MESPSKIDRRQAWAHSSRRKLTVSPTTEDPHPHFSFQDDVFVEGCSAGKIETWLQGCGNEASSTKNNHLTIGLLRTGNSFEDDLSLGAEATALYMSSNVPQFSSTPQQKLSLPLYNMGYSVASSALSSTTSRTASSVSEVLQMRAEDAEDTLFQLGFGCEEPQVTARIPVRFFNFPSQLKGINFRLFLESQLSRIRQEDPCLSLASRFRQVEALTAMANAFYSLYSHVSRTPLQKLAPPQFTFSSPIVERTMSRTSIRSEPRSPVERLKDTISKMCLYTGSRGSDSVSPSSSPRKRKSSLLGAAEKEVETAENDDANDLATNPCIQMEVGDLETDINWYIENERDHEKMYDINTDTERVVESLSEPKEDSGAKVNVNTPSQTLSESCLDPAGDMEIESKGCSLLSVDLNNSSISVEPVPIIAHDVICPQVVEYVNQAPYRCPQTNSIKDSTFVYQMTNKPPIRESNVINLPTTTGALGDILHEHCPSDLPSQLTTTTQKSLCQITVTGWEEDSFFSNKDIPEDCPIIKETKKKPSSTKVKRLLSPVKPLNLSKLSHSPKQASSFELEEVHSAEEEEATSSEHCSTVTLSVSTHQKSLPLRGDSFQSDSSGYVEEDVHHSTPEKT